LSKGFVHEATVGESVEWYTPPGVFEALGLAFDLDPASPAGGLPWVPARKIYTAADDGLTQPWKGRVWLNPPYGPGIGRWLERLAEHGNGIALVFNRSDTKWWQRVIPYASATCFIRGRLRFVGPDGQYAGSSPAPSLLVAFGLTCAIALNESGLGMTVVIPRSV
jgi:hypothetical protein